MQSRSGIIVDSNPELVNVYQCIADNVEQVIEHLRGFKNTEAYFYEIRALKYDDLEKEYAAARTIYLNRTCFNGLCPPRKSGAAILSTAVAFVLSRISGPLRVHKCRVCAAI